ncbi:hypothetical protein CYMTET_14320, partial [Cymbomonas tetramitiformis]
MTDYHHLKDDGGSIAFVNDCRVGYELTEFSSSRWAPKHEPIVTEVEKGRDPRKFGIVLSTSLCMFFFMLVLLTGSVKMDFNNPCEEEEETRPCDFTMGVNVFSKAAYPGYTLLSNIGSPTTYLLNNSGAVVKSFHLRGMLRAHKAALSDRGSLYGLVVERKCLMLSAYWWLEKDCESYIQEVSWQGEPLWQWKPMSNRVTLGQDVVRMPSGNYLALVYTGLTSEEALELGLDPKLLRASTGQGRGWDFTYSGLREIMPTGPFTGEVVWQWESIEHIVQDYDESKANYDKVHKRPELYNLNHVDALLDKTRTVNASGVWEPGLQPFMHISSLVSKHCNPSSCSEATGHWDDRAPAVKRPGTGMT